MATVCNVRVKNIRPQYENLAAWMADPQNVYVGRGGIVFIEGVRFPPADSIWANPYRIEPGRTREESLGLYRAYISRRLAAEPALQAQLGALRGKKLGCWCYPLPCHADILAGLAAETA